MAEESGSRTHQGRLTPLTGFEVQAHHRIRFPSIFQSTLSHPIDLGRRLADIAVIAAPAGKADAVELFRHLDGHVATDAGNVAQRLDGQGAVLLGDGFRHGAQLAERMGQ